jgi:RNA polymerase sigma-70 factor (ECF subfamily)
LKNSPQNRFQTTQWSIVQAAANDQSTSSRAALEYLCQKYWFPLYSFVCRKTGDVELSKDITQAFFAQLLEKSYLPQADQSKGKFRTFLLTSMTHFIANYRKKERAQKRGGNKPLFSLDFDQSRKRIDALARTDSSPENLFERQWALDLLASAIAQLKAEYESDSKPDQFQTLKPALTFPSTKIPYLQMAEEIGTSEANVKVMVHRLRKRYGEILRASIAETLDDSDSVDAEIADLFAILSG